MKRYIRSHRKGFQAIGLMVAVAFAAGLAFAAFQGAHNAGAVSDATIIGKVLAPGGSPISFTCMAPPGSPPPLGPCSIGVEANAGPDTPPAWSGASTTDGSFSLSVTGGKKYKIEFRGPPEAIGQYTFPTLFVDAVTGQTSDLGTITATEKTGRISGIVKDGAGVPVAGAQVNAFPMFKPEDQGSEPKGPMMPAMATTGVDGIFTLLVDPGRYGINLMQSPDSQYVTAGGPPLEANCDIATCNVTGIVITAVKADATITGLIVKEDGTSVFLNGGVGARPVSTGTEGPGFEYNGPIQPQNNVPGQPPSGGMYTIKVPSSTSQYMLVVHVGMGGPNDSGPSYSVKGTITVTVTPNGTTTQNITVVQDSSSIFGKVVSDSGFALQGCTAKGDAFGGQNFGEVFAHNDKGGKFARADIKADCSYKMVLGEGDYNFGYHLNPKAGYINKPAPPEPIHVAANTDVEKNISVMAGDGTITGQIFNADGSPMANVWVEAGNEGEARAEFKSGGQEGFDEKTLPGGSNKPEDMMKYCSQKKNEAECRKFTLPPGATGPGGCKNMLECTQYCTKNPKICQEFDKAGHDKPEGMGKVFGQGYRMSVAASKGRFRVMAEDVTKKPQGPDFMQNVIHMGTQAGPDGKFTLPVVSGHIYEVRAMLPPGQGGGVIPPKSASADLRTAKTVNVVLSFRSAFGTMTGTVLMPNGTPADRCFVKYWNEAGDDGGSPCNQNGSFSLGYSQGKLHVMADSFNGNTPYGTDEQIIMVTNQKTLKVDFKLKERGFDVPSPASKTFSADEQTTLMLDNGVEINIPAGAMGESGNVTVSATPTINLKSTESSTPVGVGYTLTATDANGQSITTFSSPVTIKIPYKEDYVTKDLGLNESLLKTAYIDDTTGAYNDNANSTQNTTDNSFTIVVDHFTDYTIVSPGGVNLKSVAVSSTGAKKAKIVINNTVTIQLPDKKDNWKVGTANFGSTGQLIVVTNISDKANKKFAGKVTLYSTNGKVKQTITPFKGFTGGLDMVVEDITAKTGNAPDGTDDITVAPATSGPAKAVVIDVKNKKNQTLNTGSGKGATALNTAELLQGGIANLTTLFNNKGAMAWKMSKGKLIEAKGAISGQLSVKNGKVEKKVVTPTVKKMVGACSSTTSKKVTLRGSGFGVTSAPIVLWNATSALAVQSFSDTALVLTLNPSAVSVKAGVNTVTIVNSDGQAGVKVLTCGL